MFSCKRDIFIQMSQKVEDGISGSMQNKNICEGQENCIFELYTAVTLKFEVFFYKVFTIKCKGEGATNANDRLKFLKQTL